MENNYKRFDIVLADLGDEEHAIGSEQSGIRPALIVQNDRGNIHSSCTIVIPLSSKVKNLNMPTHSLIRKGRGKGLHQDSILLGECIKQISEKRIIQYLGSITDKEEQAEVKRVYLANFGD